MVSRRRVATAWAVPGASGKLLLEGVELEKYFFYISYSLSLQVDGSEDYGVTVRRLAMDFSKKGSAGRLEGRKPTHRISLVTPGSNNVGISPNM